MTALTSSAIALVGELVENFAFLMPNGTCAPPPPGTWDVVLAVDYRKIGCGDQGRILIALTAGPAAEAARNILGLDPGAPVDAASRREAASELANIIAGNLLPHLLGDGEGFDLGQPVALPLREATLDICIDLGDGVLGVSVEAHSA